MILEVKPTTRLKGKIQLPASKSYSIRAFMVAACGGNSRIIAPSDCDDAKVALIIAKALGAKVTRLKDGWQVLAGRQGVAHKNFDVGESGTALRFLLPLLPFYAQQASVRGKGTLVGRPNGHLLHTLRSRGMVIKGKGAKESVPIIYQGGGLKPGVIEINGSVSSQFISALLIACPRLEGDSRIRIIGPEFVSADYVTMTVQILNKAGIHCKAVGSREFLIKGGQVFKGLRNFHVPSDYGLAAFWLAAGCLVNADLRLQGNFQDDLIQSDGHIMGFLKRMGVRFERTRSAINIHGPFRLKGGEFSLKACPDLVPIMTVLSLFAKGPTTLKNIRHARVKESDRISDLRRELLKIGAKITEFPDALRIDPLEHYKTAVTLDPHHDHRLAMAFAILGLKVAARIKDMECSHKSYPGFVKDLKTVLAD